MKLRDTHNRIANYLRIGVTDRCNLRCRYCMPEQGIDFAHREDILSYEEVVRLGKIFKNLGVEKVRLTGGEPFVRKDIGLLLAELTAIFPKVHITTNATLIEEHISIMEKLRVSGLNISIDSLDRERFFMITRRDDFDKVLANIKRCLTTNIPTKLNVVVMAGVNDMEIIDFVEFGMKHDVEVRFIEAMPFNDDDGNKPVFIPATDILNIIKEQYSTIEKDVNLRVSSAESYKIGAYKLSIIPAYTRSLCSSCNRVRLTPKGKLLTCLYAKEGTDLLSLVRAVDATDEMIAEAILNSVKHKRKDGFEEEAKRFEKIFDSMTTIGG